MLARGKGPGCDMGHTLCAYLDVTREALFRDGHHRTNDRIARL
jgi:hypothetical protein